MGFHDLIRQAFIRLGFIRQPDFSARIVSIHPTAEETQPGQMIVVGGAKYQKWACFRCPGQCGETILLSLAPIRHPYWTVSNDWLGRPTIKPSIRQLSECGCHFWIRQGSVHWCSDSSRVHPSYEE